jgi:hypothetical protein
MTLSNDGAAALVALEAVATGARNFREVRAAIDDAVRRGELQASIDDDVIAAILATLKRMPRNALDNAVDVVVGRMRRRAKWGDVEM